MPFLATEHLRYPSVDLLSWMFDESRYDTNKPIYIDAANPGRTISARQARRIIRSLAAGLKKAGMKKGDCVCIHAFNDIFYSMLCLGIIAAGGIFAGTNPSYTSYELSHAIRTAKVKMLLVEPGLLRNVLTAAETCGILRSQVFVFDVHATWHAENGIRSFSWLTDQGEVDWERFDDRSISETTPAAKLFSSGTTGMPKALDMSHYNFVAQHTMVLEYKPRDYEVRRLLCNPMFHVSIVPRAHTSPLRSGVVTYVMRRFDLESWLRYIWTYKITEINMVPPMVHAVLSRPDLTARYPLDSVRNAWCGAAPLSREAQERFKMLLRGDAPFNQVWGMSETSCIATMTHYPEYDSSGSSGRLLPDLDCKLVDEAGNDITGYRIRGELCVRGPTIVRGYFENEEATRASWDKDGYFHTGDIAYCEPENERWHIVDRKKDLIKVRGFQVAPAELEGVLFSHPSIIDAAVIGVPKSDGSSELPRAYVVTNPEAALTEQEVQGFIGEKLAKYKRLDGGVVFVDVIPKNASGKILKNSLRERAKKEMSAKL